MNLTQRSISSISKVAVIAIIGIATGCSTNTQTGRGSPPTPTALETADALDDRNERGAPVRVEAVMEPTAGDAAPTSSAATGTPVAPTEPPAPADGGSTDEGVGEPTAEPGACEGCAAEVPLDDFEVWVPPTSASGGLAAGDEAFAGCAVDCIQSATADPWAGGDGVTVEINTDTPSFVRLFLSSGPFDLDETKDGGPRVRNGDAVAQTVGDLDEWFSAEIGDLTGGTTYWVAVSATDANGGESWAQGSFTTATEPHRTPPPTPDVRVQLLSLTITYDGDAGANRGELGFDVMLVSPDVATPARVGSRSGRWEDRTTLELAESFGYIHNDLDGRLHDLEITGVEYDPRGTQYCTAGAPDIDVPGDAGCPTINLLVVDGVSWAQISEMATCAAFGIEGDRAEWKCTRLSTTERGGGRPEFSVLVAYGSVE
jgi:hypothetical protein